MNCVVCGNEFEKKVHNQIYCTPHCRDFEKRKYNRAYNKKKRHEDHTRGKPSELLGTALSDMRIVKYKGQQRVRAAVILQKLTRRIQREKKAKKIV